MRPVLTAIAIYAMPVLLLLFGVISFERRFQVLIIMALVAALLAAFRQYTPSKLGFHRPRLSGMLTWSIIPSILLLAGVFITDLPHRLFTLERLPFYLFFIFVSSPAQEFLYRSFLHTELKAVRLSRLSTIIVSASLFSFMHVIYKDSLTVALTFLAGLVWSAVFTRTNSFYIGALSHAAVGAVTIELGVI